MICKGLSFSLFLCFVVVILRDTDIRHAKVFIQKVCDRKLIKHMR